MRQPRAGDQVKGTIYPWAGTVLATMPLSSQPDTKVRLDDGTTEWCYSQTEIEPGGSRPAVKPGTQVWFAAGLGIWRVGTVREVSADGLVTVEYQGQRLYPRELQHVHVLVLP